MALATAAALVPPTSAASPNLFASVAGNGTLVNGNGVSSVSHTIGSGQYEVTFTSDVSSCAYVSTTQNAFSQALQSYTAGGHLSSSGVYVETKNQGGGLTDGPFDLAVACGLTGWDFAVVGYTANLVRSSPGATLTHLSAGRYDVNFTAGVGGVRFPRHRR
jgi:threonine dehydrogenase-like Zn-dependent dehydrogenase